MDDYKRMKLVAGVASALLSGILRCALLGGAGLFLCSCEGEVLLKFGSIKAAEKARVVLDFCCDAPASEGVGVKSALFRDEDIKDINLFLWSNGRCVSHSYLPEIEGGAVSLDLARRRSYSFYVLANCGQEITPSESGWMSDEESMERLRVSLGAVSAADGKVSGNADEESSSGTASESERLIPLSGALRDYTLPEIGTHITLRLERLLCRIILSFSCDEALSGSGIKVTGVRLCDAPLSVSPFSKKSRSEQNGVSSGDYSSPEDIARLNAGEAVEFYSFENCWGDLLEGNTDPGQKIPDNLEVDHGPTYLEVGCAFDDGKLLGGELTYRIYLGADITSNFDLERNCSYSIRLSGSKNGLGELSWRIDKNVSYNDNLASFSITEGRHGADDLYIGEIFRAKVSDIDPSVTAFFGGSLQEMSNSCTLRCINPNNGDSSNDPIVFSTDGVGSDGTIAVTGVCQSELQDAQLWICDAEGDPITRIGEEVSVWPPEVVLSTEAQGETPSEVEKNPTAVLNGEQVRLYAYLCDRDGHNLLCHNDNGLVFHSKAYSLEAVLGIGSVSASKNCFSCRLDNIYEEKDLLEDQPYCALVLKAVNAGDSETVNTELWNVVSTSGPLSLGIRDERHNVSGNIPADVGYTKISTVFYDTAYGGKELAEEYGFSAAEEPLFVIVNNPSRMSFKFKYMALTKRGSAKSYSKLSPQDGALICAYNCPSSLTLPPNLYLHYAEADVKSLTSSSAISCHITHSPEGITRIGLKRDFAQLINAVKTGEGILCYNKYGYYDSALTTPSTRGFPITGGICAMFDLATGPGARMEYSYEDALLDSSEESKYVYLNDYYPLSVRFYSAGEYFGNIDGETYSYSAYPDLTPWNLSGIVGNKRTVVIGMNNTTTTSPYFTLKADKTFSGVRAQASLTCLGACNTYANGTKRDPVYYSFEKSATATGVYLQSLTAGAASSFTGSSISSLFTSVYNTTYTDSHNWYGNSNNWQHHSHPTKLTLDATFSEGGSNRYLYDFAAYTPVSLTYDNSGYVTEDANPYTVVTAVDWKSLHGKFTHKMILLQ